MMIILPDGNKLRYRGRWRWVLIRQDPVTGVAQRVRVSDDPKRIGREITRLTTTSDKATFHVYDAHKHKIIGSGPLGIVKRREGDAANES